MSAETTAVTPGGVATATPGRPAREDCRSTYSAGCRCDLCKAQNAAYQRGYRARRRQRGTAVAVGKVTVGTDTLGRQKWRTVDDPKDKLMSRAVAGLNSCIVWTGGKNDQGYGHVNVNGRRIYVHRLSYELHVGPIPDGLVIDHLCRNRACVNHHHLEPVTAAENTRRGAAAITHCPQGHAYDEANTRRRPDGRRGCRRCDSPGRTPAHTPSALQGKPEPQPGPGWPIHRQEAK